jgi:hypothetical protein
MTNNLINKKIAIFLILTAIIACTFLQSYKYRKAEPSSYMRTRDMEDAQGYYNHEEEIKGLHVIMGNFEINSNGKRGM